MPTSLTTIDAVILAGGLGTRLRAAVPDRPKVLAEVRGRAFLSYLLDQLAGAGVRRAVLCTGYLGEQVEAAFGASYGPLELVHSREQSRLGTAGALRLARGLLASDPVLVLNGDSYTDTDLRAFFRWHQRAGAEGSLLLAEVDDVGRFGQVMVDDDGALTSFREKGGASGTGWINAGAYLLSRRIIESIPPDRAVSLEREVLPAWIGKGLCGYRAAGRFIDMGTPESYAAAERFFAERRARTERGNTP